MSQVAKDAEWVSSQSISVKINTNSVNEHANSLLHEIETGNFKTVDWSRDNPLHPDSSKENVLDWIFLVDSLNFSFWPEYGKEYSIDKQVGYWALCAAINRAEEMKIPITNPEYYKNISIEKARQIFATDQEEIEVPLLKERVDIMRFNGTVLCEQFSGKFENVLKLCDTSAQKLLDIVCEHFPSFRDEATFKGRKIQILKRAQILVADIWGCFHGTGHGHFTDINSLTIFADYRVPQVLHYMGILQYSPELMKKLKNNQNILDNGSRDEIEIRCNAIHAVELLRSKMLSEVQQSPTLQIMCKIPNSIEIDFYLWGLRRNKTTMIDQISPYHKVRCIYY